MKYLLIGLLLFSCSAKDADQKQNYDAICIVGNKYNICSAPTDNPFDPQSVATVTITAKSNGYVQYCWTHELNQPEKVLFNRTCEEFVELINNCGQRPK